ncbi:PucR family transcriptional regulator [Agromyces intestinalis]|uniref:PucR family transcriptional regulator n=1 Tax=Agromyces intestinalis TaxID=2592652 RepID=A0A5C1YD11_9MICO|nr:helix-turn-helix domain-containing protein [Agromyces intestinalis]QEO13973.1 PucR family transcriptional regulator [Agromyces intestinalis]
MSVNQLVNHIARVVGRPAVLEDQRQRVVAYSPQSGVIDEVRRKTILQHHAGPAVSSWLLRLGVYNAKVSTRVPQNAELGMLPRLLVPIRRADESMGFLWFIDAPDRMGVDEIERADHLAERLAEEWTRARAQHDLEIALMNEHTRDLLFGNAKARARSAGAIIEEGFFPDDAGVRAIQLSVRAGSGVDADDARELLERSARTATQRSVLRGALHLVRGDRAVFLVPQARAGDGTAVDSDHAAGALLDAATAVFAPVGAAAAPLVSIGGARDLLGAARASAAEAERAERISLAFGLAGPIAHWDRLGIHRGLDSAAAAGLVAADFQLGLDRLLGERDGRMLLETAEAYLALGGRAQETAARLNVHRTSLYHRLGRLERILGIDLQNGVERLGLHLAIMLMKVEADPAERV